MKLSSIKYLEKAGRQVMYARKKNLDEATEAFIAVDDQNFESDEEFKKAKDEADLNYQKALAAVNEATLAMEDLEEVEWRMV